MVNKWFYVLPVMLVVVGIFFLFPASKPPDKTKVTTQIYPNYDFPAGVSQIKVPLIPPEQRLSQQAGGWVITPAGSDVMIDYDVPVVIEYIDGRKFARQPKQPVSDGVRPANRIFRLYGKGGDSTITIKRGVHQ